MADLVPETPFHVRSDIELRVLVYQDADEAAPGEWIAVALEMDLRGYGKTVNDALAELASVVKTQIEFAIFKQNLSLIFFEAEKKYFEMYEQRLREALLATDIRPDLVELEIVAGQVLHVLVVKRLTALADSDE